MLGAGDDAAVVDFLDAGRRFSTVQTIDAWPVLAGGGRRPRMVVIYELIN
jgi:hypothetical protein